MNKKYFHSLNLIKVLALLLIFNSHCDILYPPKIQFLATGGAIGNCLFFTISGFLLNTNDNFLKYILKKIERLYPATIISALIYILIKPDIPKGLLQWISTFIWPTYLWFIGALLVFFVLAYFLFNSKLVNHFVLFTIIIFILYFVYYILLIDKSYWSVETKGILSFAGFFKLIYYFYLFCYGGYVRRKDVLFNASRVYCVIISIMCFVGSLLIKLLMQKGLLPMWVQFSVQILNIFSSIFLLDFCLKFEDYYTKWNKTILKIIDAISSLTLQINLSQLIVIDRFDSIVFPINIVIALLVTIAYAKLLKRITEIGNPIDKGKMIS